MNRFNRGVRHPTLLEFSAVRLLIGLLFALPCTLGMAKKPPDRVDQDSSEQNEEPAPRRARTLKDVYRIQQEIAAVRKNPGPAVAELVRTFAKRSGGHELRRECALALWDLPIAAGTPDYDTVLRVVNDEREHPAMRLEAAGILVHSVKPLPPETLERVRRLAFEQMPNGEVTHLALFRVLEWLPGDAKSEIFLINELKRNPGDEMRNNGIVWALGRMNAKRAVKPILDALLGAPGAPKLYRTRGYLALGGIGGKEAYDALMKCRETETGSIQKAHILEALGATKDPRAAKFLVGQLDPVGVDYSAVVRGLVYLGDPGVIPALEEEYRRLPPAERFDYNREWLRRAIENIRKGVDDYKF